MAFSAYFIANETSQHRKERYPELHWTQILISPTLSVIIIGLDL